MKISYERHILALSDTDLESFVRGWVESKKGAYAEVVRFSGPGDMGRDVVGFVGPERHEGVWDNYQCKQYSGRLPTDVAITEIGKILFYSSEGEFTVPRNYIFVAPRGVNRNLDRLINKPAEFKNMILEHWDKYCSKGIRDGDEIKLTDAIRKAIDAFDFSSIKRIGIDEILASDESRPVLFHWFGSDPGPAPKGVAPAEVQPLESNYIQKLVRAYSQRSGIVIPSHADALTHAIYARHLIRQRERFYDADAFKRFYRDNTDAATIESFEEDVMNGVVECCEASYADALARIDSVMQQAANIQVSGPLSMYAKVSVKQGMCHHFANEDRLEWEH